MQRRNPELVDILRTDFQHRNEPNFAHKSLVSLFSAIPALIALWPMSFIRRDSNTERARDISGGGYHLTADGLAVDFAYDNLVPYASFVAASTNALVRADGGAADWADVTGTEGFIPAANNGLTVGCWVYPTVDTTAAIISKYGGAGTRAYEIRVDGASQFNFYVSDDGTNTDVAIHATALTVDQWYFVVGRFDPSTNVEIFVNGTNTQQATARASVFDSGLDFHIGDRATSASYMDGRVSMAFLSCCFVSDAIINTLWQQSRIAYGQ